jgi:dephospho-CoA kinase
MPPFLIVLLGGIASGKSRVAELFHELGAVTLAADPMAHEVLKEEAVRQELRARFGEEIFTEAGSVDRKALGSKVFKDREALKFLEGLIHPRVRTRLLDALHSMEGSEAQAVATLDVPLATETGWLDRADLIVFVDCDDAERDRRAVETRGWSPGEVARREAHQTPLAEKRARSHAFVDNSHSVAEARDHVHRLWHQYVEPGLKKP